MSGISDGPYGIFQDERIKFSAQFPGTLNDSDRNFIRKIATANNSLTALRVKSLTNPPPLTQLAIESLVESKNAHTKEYQSLIQQADDYIGNAPKLEPLGNYIHVSKLWDNLKGISIEQYFAAANFIALERVKSRERVNIIVGNHKIIDPSLIEQLEMTAISKNNLKDLVTVSGSPVEEAMSRYGLVSARARETLEVFVAEGPAGEFVNSRDCNVKEVMSHFGLMTARAREKLEMIFAKGPAGEFVNSRDCNVKEVMSHFGLMTARARETLEMIFAKGPAGEFVNSRDCNVKEVMSHFGLMTARARETLEMIFAKGPAAQYVSSGQNLNSAKEKFGILSEKAVEQLEKAFVRNWLVPLIDRDFSVSASILKHNIKSKSARNILEIETAQRGATYRILRGEPWTEVVKICGIRKDSDAAKMLKDLAEKVANDPYEISRRPVWNG
ncbi:AraC family transcriptional regulator [Erwinia pyrifoliae]|uniref:AraC family transcriptional regulator n=1 Tax=Erwinia pyrifoliae TaxID=79967 RepID=UPI002202D393|nr:AraC family transcriptional regulator [Erwinia pyrifoliae]MCU8587463.1 AraC family transcriptional regulator [Erwinia pyrifoliae]UWS31309.1 AraC family transcriptional regulator [Erwinia pyrifoliae]UXK10888.1 AraC family transcriptional regulator [Erwinia pyrifoliae]